MSFPLVRSSASIKYLGPQVVPMSPTAEGGQQTSSEQTSSASVGHPSGLLRRQECASWAVGFDSVIGRWFQEDTLTRSF